MQTFGMDWTDDQSTPNKWFVLTNDGIVADDRNEPANMGAPGKLGAEIMDPQFFQPLSVPEQYLPSPVETPNANPTKTPTNTPAVVTVKQPAPAAAQSFVDWWSAFRASKYFWPVLLIAAVLIFGSDKKLKFK